MATEFDDSEHWGFFLTGQKLTSETGKYVRMSSLVLAALRAAGVFSTMEDGTTAPATDKLWLDKNTDPPTLKEWDATGASWVPMTYGRLFGQAAVGFLTVAGGTGNAVVISAPTGFQANRLYLITPTATNTGAATIQVTGVGTYNVKYGDGSDLTAGEFTTGRQTALFFDGTKFVVILAVGASGVPDGSITTPKLANGALSADATGRGKMADGFLSADTAGRAKMADGYVNTAKLASGALSADASGRAKMSDGFLSADAAGRAKMADGFVTSAKVSAGISLSSPVLSAPSGEFLRGYVSGLTVSNNATDAANDLDFSAGAAASDGTTPTLMALGAAIGKRLDAAWAAGGTPGATVGGLDTGSPANGWYYAYLIGKTTDAAAADILLSASATSPTMPSGWDLKRLIFAFERASAAIRPFTHRGGNDVSWVTPVENFNSTSVSTSGALVTVTAPPLTGARAILRTTLSHGAAAAAWFREVAQANEAVSISTADASSLGSGGRSHTVKSLAVNASSQIRYRSDIASIGSIIIVTEGFVFPRGGA